MWQPKEDLSGFNRALVLFEQVFLSVLRGSRPLEELIASPLLQELWQYVDENPYQALLMTRIKSGHAMTPRHGINVMLAVRAWVRVCHKLGSRLDKLSLAALLHDLGHWRSGSLIYVFGPFTHDEARLMQEHASPPRIPFRGWMRMFSSGSVSTMNNQMGGVIQMQLPIHIHWPGSCGLWIVLRGSQHHAGFAGPIAGPRR